MKNIVLLKGFFVLLVKPISSPKSRQISSLQLNVNKIYIHTSQAACVHACLLSNCSKHRGSLPKLFLSDAPHAEQLPYFRP